MEDQEAIDALIEEAKAICEKYPPPESTQRVSAYKLLKSGRTVHAIRCKRERESAASAKAKTINRMLRLNGQVFLSQSQRLASLIRFEVHQFQSNESIQSLMRISQMIGKISILEQFEPHFNEAEKIASMAIANREDSCVFLTEVRKFIGSDVTGHDAWKKKRDDANKKLREWGSSRKISLHTSDDDQSKWHLQFYFSEFGFG